MNIPETVKRACETIGGYLGLTYQYYTVSGEETDTQPEDGWLVVGSYYGSILFEIDEFQLIHRGG
jgi:hypothetical protein